MPNTFEIVDAQLKTLPAEVTSSPQCCAKEIEVAVAIAPQTLSAPAN
ncbi:hypothetical protein [Sodalis-like endosymbiont of Proechinophthirus fluctus]|nr:hypothetical protein [Sodalis-like endosymbiont of Proechinophthirus fluctus]